MSIVVTLSPELEALLRNRAARQGQDVSLLASQLLASILQAEEQDLEAAIEGIQRSLDDFQAGKFRSFEDFAHEQRQKYNLSAD
jgi:hypothetical protein